MNSEKLKKQLKRKDLKDEIFTYSALKQLIRLSRIIDGTFTGSDIVKIISFNEFNIKDWVANYNILLNYKGDSSSLAVHILRYGETEGTHRFKLKNKQCLHSKQVYIERHGEVLGNQKWVEYSNKLKLAGSLKGYIKKHGEVQGKEKWDKVNKSKTPSLENYGKEKWDKFCKQNSYSRTVEYYVEKYGKIEGPKIFEEKNSVDLFRGKDTSDTQIAYWTKQGLSDEEATVKVKERQITFSLATCIEKYGKEKGLVIFKARQQKWQDTLNDKTNEEKDRINFLKSGGLMSRLFKSNEEPKYIPGTLYYIRFYSDEIEFWKIGITSYNVQKRFGSDKSLFVHYGLKKEILFENNTMSFYDAFKEEQRILRNNTDNRITVNYNGFTSTECFTKDILKKDYEWKN